MKARLNSRIYGPKDSVVANAGELVDIVGADGDYKPLPQSTLLGVSPFRTQRYKEYLVRLADGSLATVDAEDLNPHV